MEKFKLFLNTPLGSLVKVFLSAILTIVLDKWSHNIDIFTLDWRTVISGAVGSVLPIVINLLNDKDPRYGAGKKEL